ncbi:MAG: hypothetical protein NVS3B12_30910 [Acidimicrobiales bacterium]
MPIVRATVALPVDIGAASNPRTCALRSAVRIRELGGVRRACVTPARWTIRMTRKIRTGALLAMGSQGADAVGAAGMRSVHERRGCRLPSDVWHHPDGRMAKIKRRDFAP